MVMPDFLAIRHRHLQVFNQYQRRKREIAQPVLHSQAKIEGIKSTALAVDRQVRSRSNFLRGELIGRSVNLVI